MAAPLYRITAIHHFPSSSPHVTFFHETTQIRDEFNNYANVVRLCYDTTFDLDDLESLPSMN